MTNLDWIAEEGIDIDDLKVMKKPMENTIYGVFWKTKLIKPFIKYKKYPISDWEMIKWWFNQEHIEDKENPILDEAERKYLENVIRPWKDKVRYISKCEDKENNIEWIAIYNRDMRCTYYGTTEFPCFKKGTMYTGMETWKHYTDVDLGLFA